MQELYHKANQYIHQEHGTPENARRRGLADGGMILSSGVIGAAALPFINNPSLLVRTGAVAAVSTAMLIEGLVLAGQKEEFWERARYVGKLLLAFGAGGATTFLAQEDTRSKVIGGAGVAALAIETVSEVLSKPLRRHLEEKAIYESTLRDPGEARVFFQKNLRSENLRSDGYANQQIIVDDNP